MTNTQLKTQIDADITNKTTAESVTTDNVGENLKDIVDYITEQSALKKNKLFNSIVGFLSYDGTNFTYTSIVNETLATIAWSKFSGTILGTMSTSVLTTDKTIVKDQTIPTGGGYIVTGRQSNETIFTMLCTSTAGSNSTVPNFTNMPIQIEILV